MIRLLPTNHSFTPVPNDFILKSMAKMSSTVIKIYLFLLYQFEQHYPVLDLDEIADSLSVTESDVKRAISHLAKENLLLCQSENNEYSSIALPASLPYSTEEPKDIPNADKLSSNRTASTSPLPAHQSVNIANLPENNLPKTDDLSAVADRLPTVQTRPGYSASTIEAFSQDKDGEQLIFYTKTLLRKNLTTTDYHILYGLRDWLHMSYDLIYFLIEHCAEKNHTRLNYIEKIAIDWHENHIETIEQAKDYLATYPSYYYTVLKAYGIYNLAPIPSQMEMIDKWLKEYQMPMEVIVYACEKTILNIAKPEMNYTDSILKDWHKKNLRNKEQIISLEAEAKKAKPTAIPKASNKSTATTKTTTFNNYSQRNEDYDAMEKRALEMRIKKKENGQ